MLPVINESLYLLFALLIHAQLHSRNLGEGGVIDKDEDSEYETP
jgi:hypothetical protein